MAVNVPGLPIEVDPLINEANRRKRRRRFVLGAALAGVVALAIALTVALRPRGPESPRGGGSITHAAETRHAEARAGAENLLRRVPLPAGARRISPRTVVRGYLSGGGNAYTQREYRHAVWQVRAPAVSVAAFMRKHPPTAFTLTNFDGPEAFPFQHN